MEFRVTITLGNDAMRTAHDVSEALERVARDMFPSWEAHYDAPGSGVIHDTNGNRVGTYGVSNDE